MKFVRTIVLSVLLSMIGCKSGNEEKKKELESGDGIELEAPEKIAYAHGYENWKRINEIAFTFNVDRENSHFERKWIWFPKTKNVVHITSTDTISYSRNAMDSVAYKVNAGFTNDRFWLFAPFNLIWDKGSYEYLIVENDSAPLTNRPMKRMTITYGDKGGYTPGDAYDFYFEDDFLIKEWVFRKGNAEEPSLITTWENYLDTLGLKLARSHKNELGDFHLYFDGFEIKTEN